MIDIKDLLEALDALDRLPDTHDKEWYKRLSKAADEAVKREIKPEAEH